MSGNYLVIYDKGHIGKQLKRLRVASHIKIVDIAKMMGVSHSTVCNFESGYHAYKNNWDKITKYLNALGYNRFLVDIVTPIPSDNIDDSEL